jgi:hypothetical protein
MQVVRCSRHSSKAGEARTPTDLLSCRHDQLVSIGWQVCLRIVRGASSAIPTFKFGEQFREDLPKANQSAGLGIVRLAI